MIDTATCVRASRQVKQVSPFSPNLAVDQDEVWFTLKDSGKTQVVSAKPPFETLAVLETGPITNHVTFIANADGHFAYVSVGGKDEVLVYRRDAGSEPVAYRDRPCGRLPHGIWGSADGQTRLCRIENGVREKQSTLGPIRSSLRFPAWPVAGRLSLRARGRYRCLTAAIRI